jgi:hypothetical protein
MNNTNITVQAYVAQKREARMLIATGFKGVGKTRATIDMLLKDYIRGNVALGIRPRRVLILDVNDEYGEYGIKALDPKDIQLFMRHPTIEIRRLRPFIIDKGVPRKLTIDEILKLLNYVLGVYAGGCLLIEDINKIVGDAMTQDLMGTICTSRHINCDIIMHYQSIARPLPKIWQNTDIIRFHWQSDDVMSSKGKLMENTEPLKICQMIVNYEKYEKNNPRFYVYFDRNKNCIIGNFTKQTFDFILDEYISENSSSLKKFLQKKNELGKPIYTYPQAVEAKRKELFKIYWGNENMN